MGADISAYRSIDWTDEEYIAKGWYKLGSSIRPDTWQRGPNAEEFPEQEEFGIFYSTGAYLAAAILDHHAPPSIEPIEFSSYQHYSEEVIKAAVNTDYTLEQYNRESPIRQATEEDWLIAMNFIRTAASNNCWASFSN